ncbi:MAG: anthranilate phosphoribosyltransferase [Alphaproteobacteria bacterium]|nr:anthranilate phosphoribosyltransferase [Alphaproteobacteria bacterium]|tara:strand:+ start:27144 stop:28199 length:1056 start_codon:yes stop_codon:yes gene_type:complete
MINTCIKTLQNGQSLSEDQMIAAMNAIMSGDVSHDDLLIFLIALSDKGENIDEITAAAKVMREKAIGMQSPYGAVDCCGTGGDAKGTYNVSTAVSIIAAACGVPMVKHGNRASSSKSGAADVLEVLGVNLDADIRNIAYAIKALNFAFFMAPNYHPAMRHVAAVRKEIGKRTIFNLLGPLANPAKARIQLIGVYDKKLTRTFAEVLKRLGSKRALIVHGADGLDEISISAETHFARLDEEGTITEGTLTPDDFGLKTHKMDDIIGGSPEDNAVALRALLEGKTGAYRDIVLANTAAVINLHDPEITLTDAITKAAAAIDSGDAYELFKDYIAITRLDHETHPEIKDMAIND